MREPNGPDFHDEARAMRNLSSVSDTRIVTSSDLQTAPASLTYTWELEGNGTWAAYKDALTKEFQKRPQFRAADTDDGSLVFVQTLPGDVCTLRAEELQPGPPLKVRITFKGRAD